jgi:short-subunit dehydrogenase
VIALGRNAAALEQTGDEIVVCDLTEPGAWRVAAGRADDVDVLVNNAGAGWAGPIDAMPAEDLERLVALNLTVPMLLTRALVPGMVRRGRGHVVNVASVVAYTGRGDEAVYAATKGGLVAFTESLRQELSGTGVHASLVTPAVIDTAFFDRRGSAYDRSWPQPLPPERVGDAVVRAIRSGRAEIFVPGWMTIPARLRGAAPGLFRRAIDRFG